MIPGFTTVTTLSQLDRLLPQADTLICCLPETAETRGLLSRKRIAQMKQGSVLINVGRGSLVDTEALTQALQAGCLAGAGLDVTDPEPLPADHPLRRMPQVILTPPCRGCRLWPPTADGAAHPDALPGKCPRFGRRHGAELFGRF